MWALQCIGVRCVIAASFGDIFFNNCFQNGVLPIRLARADIETLARSCASGDPITVDLTACILTGPDGRTQPFEVEPLRRQALLEGLDDIGLTMKHDSEIRDWQARDRAMRPWAWPERQDKA